ncbi:MAG: metallophosphoesterase [Aurantimicrobium sp.]|uniref:metallophosphoesterase n=1 Tax=Aurantimicrobium sp. TaxID=1930784 RepID=UPI0032200FE0
MSSSSAIGRDVLVGIGLVAVGALAWGTLVERNAFTLRNVEAKVLEPGSAPLRILHISDLHLAPWQKGKMEWISSLAELAPDLVVNTGDNLGHHDALPALQETLVAFKGIPGVFVNGSNDYFAPEFKNPFAYFAGPSKATKVAERLDTASLMEFFTDELGWANLNNSAASLTLGSRRIDFMGVDDPHRSFDSLARMERALESIQSDDFLDDVTPDITIGVAHAPYQRILNDFVTQGAEMIFAGHTHGGQVCVPGLGALVTNCDIPRDKVKGLSTWTRGSRTAALNVSAGVGTSIFAPVRFACAPEASLVTLSAREG